MKTTVDDFRTLERVTILNLGRHAGSAEIRGALRYVPSDLLEADHLALPIPHDWPVVLYDERGDDAYLEPYAEKLRSQGFEDVRILEGGFEAYRAADLPVQESSTEQVVPPSRPQEADELDRRL